MKRPTLLILSLLAAACATTRGAGSSSAAGPLIVVGGGGTPDEVVTLALELAGGPAARVVVLPYASEREERGTGSVELWREAGATDVVLVDPPDEAGLAAIRAADLVWMPGGAQTRLAEALRDAGYDEAIRAAHARGAVVGGTSAGAAVLSGVMISGSPEPASYHAGAMEAHEGLGLWQGVIVDQHFAQREREGRLVTAVIDHPELVGIGISERTAAVVRGGAFEVVGEGPIVVIDGRRARVGTIPAGEQQSARGLALHVLTPGERFSVH